MIGYVIKDKTFCAFLVTNENRFTGPRVTLGSMGLLKCGITKATKYLEVHIRERIFKEKFIRTVGV